jgi:hypothetical protein
MSSHREAPAISKDPVADSTDLYAFVSPDLTDTVTIIANYVPLEGPASGPNFFEFGNDVLYEINIDNNGDAAADITYQFRFETEITNPDTFLYNVGPIMSIDSPNWIRRQFMTVHRVMNGRTELLGEHLPCPPCNVGVLSTPEFPALANEAIHELPGEVRVYAGQRREGFYVDLGSIFDLGNLRPIEELQVFAKAAGLSAMPGVDATAGVNVHSIAIRVPIHSLTSNGRTPTSVSDPTAAIGIWTTASRQKVLIRDRPGTAGIASGPWTQVSRLGNPLVNEVIIPMAMKDLWNSLAPGADRQFINYVAHPELAGLIPVLYPGTASAPLFPHLAELVKSGAPRADLEAVLLTGVPGGLVPGFQTYTGPTPADMLRLNLAIPPASTGTNTISGFHGNPLGVLGGDLAGYPNGRRVFDDVVTIELRAVAGAIYGLVDKSYTPDAAVADVSDFANYQGVPVDLYQIDFPYLGTPLNGYDNMTFPVV